MFKKDYFFVGVVLGALLPLIISVIINVVYKMLLDKTDFDIMTSKPALMGCLILNILLFRVFMVNLKKYTMAKGLLLATLIFAFLILMK
ncbi:MAG: hypothetical protein PHT69_12945 [Bacteroidales bacterium]|nr:hypothetical protein [Bacteroidales bacterium]